MKTEDDMLGLRGKVTEIFSRIPNQGLGIQNFAIRSKKPVALPYERNMNEMLVFNSVKNVNELYIYFTYHAPEANQRTRRSLLFYLLAQLIGHEGKGSLYQDLKG